MADESYKLDVIGIRIPDANNLVEVLNLVLGKQQAEDIAKCHNNLVDVRYSKLTIEVEAARDRVDGLITDYWAEKGRATAEAEMAKARDDDDEIEEDDEVFELAADVKPLGHIDPSSKAPGLVFEDDEPEDDEE